MAKFNVGEIYKHVGTSNITYTLISEYPYKAAFLTKDNVTGTTFDLSISSLEGFINNGTLELVVADPGAIETAIQELLDAYIRDLHSTPKVVHMLQKQACSCDSFNLFNYGCKCGAIDSERKAK